ncbi:MAG: LLM class flavin-dependent oxidoreductase [Conexivisphaerales archaeon]
MDLLEKSGLMIEPQEGLDPQQVLQAAEVAETLGFGYIFRSDHLLPTSGRRGLATPECWTTLAAIAVKTNRIRFGPLVSPIGFRSPALLAKMVSTVHSLSNGRLQLGLGAGWYGDEYLAHGFAFPDFRNRKEQLREAAIIFDSLVKTGKVDFKGKYFSANFELPGPITDLYRIIGGKAPSILNIAGQFADEINIFAPSEAEFERLKPFLKPNLQVSQMGPFFIAKDREELKMKISRRMKLVGSSLAYEEYLARLKARNAFIGTHTDFADQLAERIRWGIRKFYFQTLEPEDSRSLEMLSEVLKSV